MSSIIEHQTTVNANTHSNIYTMQVVDKENNKVFYVLYWTVVLTTAELNQSLRVEAYS